MATGCEDNLLRKLRYSCRIIDLPNKTGNGPRPRDQTMDDSVQIRCHRCKSCFREKARRLQSGYSRQCISCETMLFFDDGSADKNIQRTLRDARRIRKELREAEAVKFATSALVSSSREASSARSMTSGREE